MEPRPTWDQVYMTKAFVIAAKSPDPSTQVGAIVAAPDNTEVSSGYNGWPRGIAPFAQDDPRWNRPEKYFWMAHAERNALDNALRNGVPLNGCTLYSLVVPCADCARGIVQVGISRIVYHAGVMESFYRHMSANQEWVKGLKASDDMLKEAGIEVCEFKEPLVKPVVRISGVEYCPYDPPTTVRGFRSVGPVSAGKVGE